MEEMNSPLLVATDVTDWATDFGLCFPDHGWRDQEAFA
jgi:hypothetical protein